MNLTTGKSEMLAHMLGLGGKVFTQIERCGVVYAFPNPTFHGLTTATLVYVPFAEVAKAVS